MSEDWPGTPVQTPASDKVQSTEDWPGTPVDAAPKADFSWKKTYQDIPTEIGNEASAGAADVAALGRRDEMGPIEGLMSVPKAVLGAGRVALSPAIGAVKSVVGHGMANLEHLAGTYINPEVAAKDNPEKMYETAKGDVDTAMSAARPAGAPVKVPGLSTTAPHPTVPGATITTTPNPAYEWKGPVAAKPKPTGLVDQPETSEFFDAADNHYSNMRGFGVEVKKQAVKDIATNARTDLEANGHEDFTDPKTYAALNLFDKRIPGQTANISQIDGVRKVLGRISKNDPVERDAARRVIGHIDDYLANLKNNQQDVVVNPHFADRVSEEALAARGNYAVAKRSEDLDEALDKAKRQAGRAGAGGNINNAIRQQLSFLRNNRKKMLGWTDAEKAELDATIHGTTSANATRQAGKFAPHGIVSTVMSAGAGHALMPGVGEVAVPAAGWIAKKIGDRITQAAAARLQNVVKARSPLGKQNSINAAAQSALAPPVTKPPRLLTSSVAAGLPHRVGIPQRLMIYPQRAEQDDQNKPTTAGFASGGAVHAHVQVQAGRVDTKPTDQQKEVGNYRKGHVRVHGLPISIENPKGSYREGKDANGKPWRSKLPAHYGYIKKTEGADGDHVDIYVGPKLKSPLIYVIDQHDHRTGKFDEHKAFLGFDNAKDVRRTYHDSFTDGRAGDRLRHMAEMTVNQFKAWLKDGDTSRPLKKKELATGGRANFADGGAPNVEPDTGGEIPSADTSAGPIPDTQAMFTTGSRLADKLLGTGGQERYQTWPEKLARSALDAPHAAMTSETPVTTEEMIAPAQDMAGLAGTGGLGGTSAAGMALGTGPIRRYPMAPKERWYGEANYETTGGKMTAMTPDEFLAQSRPMKMDEVTRENVDDLKRHIEEGGELDPLQLYGNGKEDGRHRAIAAKELGIKEVPVINFRSDTAGPGAPLAALEHAPRTGFQLPQGYYDKIPREMRLSRKGVSHPGVRWEVYDPKTGKVMSSDLTTRSGASRSQDRLDNKYGAVRYRVRPTRAKELTEEEANFLKDKDISFAEDQRKHGGPVKLRSALKTAYAMRAWR